MPFRVTTLIITFLLLWSGLGPIAAAGTVARVSHESNLAMVHDDGDVAPHVGNLTHHDLDVVPSPASPTLGDTLADPPELLSATATASAPTMRVTCPRATTAAETGPPFLAGPLRPPCRATRAS
jgi:hypothetical protein